MTSDQADRIFLGWSHEQLARLSGVSVASVYLLERLGTAGPDDDTRIRNKLAHGKAQNNKATECLALNQ